MAAGNGDEADAPLDDAISPELRAKAKDAGKSWTIRKRADAGADSRDLWDRMRSGFAMDHSVDNARVKSQLDWYARHPSYIKRVVEQAPVTAYCGRNRGLGFADEMALLPIVESAFDPFAYSHGRAAGLWQFIPSTGKYFGLTQSWWHDDRRDVLEATDAA